MRWDCSQTEERLSEFIDRHMSTDESAAFSVHLASCDDCSRLYRAVSGLVTQLQALEALEEPKRLESKIIHATLGSPWKRRFDWVRGMLTPRFAVGAATAAACLMIVLGFAGVTPKKIKRADLSPVNIARSANRQVHLAYARSAKFVNDLKVVYEIQAMLQRTQDQSPTQEEHQPPPPPANPQEKSQKDSRPRSQIHSGALLAWIVPPDFPRSAR